jgi:cysteinyl-tRNA synthetase
LLVEAAQKLDRLYGALRDAGIEGPGTAEPEITLPETVVTALEDDINTPRALAELFELARLANRSEDPKERRDLAARLRAGALLLGLLQSSPAEWFSAAREGSADGLADAEIESLIARRESLRGARQFAEADGIRDALAAQGIVLEDSDGQTRWRRAR